MFSCAASWVTNPAKSSLCILGISDAISLHRSADARTLRLHLLLLREAVHAMKKRARSRAGGYTDRRLRRQAVNNSFMKKTRRRTMRAFRSSRSMRASMSKIMPKSESPDESGFLVPEKGADRDGGVSGDHATANGLCKLWR